MILLEKRFNQYRHFELDGKNVEINDSFYDEGIHESSFIEREENNGWIIKTYFLTKEQADKITN
jgi:hypothetical protein